MKYVFVDMDGTMLKDDKSVCKENIEAVKLALSQGNKIIVTTGRPLASAILAAEKIGLAGFGCYILAFNGGIIYDCTEKKVLYRTTLKAEDTEYLFKEARSYGLHIQAYADSMAYVESFNKECEYYSMVSQFPFVACKDVPALLGEAETPKLLLISFEKEKLLKFQADHLDFEKGRMLSLFSCDYFLEYMPLETGKGNGIRKMSEILDFPMDDTIAIGDEENDISMIREAHIGVCMINGKEKAKAVANYITENDNNHGGVAEVLRKFVIDK